MMTTELAALLELLQLWRQHKDAQAYFVQKYIQDYGPIPDEFGDQIRELLT